MHITEVFHVQGDLTGSATTMRLAYNIFNTSNAIKQITENTIVTIRLLDQKYSYTSLCNGSTLIYDATNKRLSVLGTIKCQIPDTLKIVGALEDIEPLTSVEVHLEIASLDYLLETLQEYQDRNHQLESRVSRLEKCIDALVKAFQ